MESESAYRSNKTHHNKADIEEVVEDKTPTTTPAATKKIEKKIKELLKLARELGLNIDEKTFEDPETRRADETHKTGDKDEKTGDKDQETGDKDQENHETRAACEKQEELLVIVAEPLKTNSESKSDNCGGGNIKQQIMRIENTLFDFCRAYSSISNAIDSLKDCVMTLPKKIDEQFSKIDELIESEKRLMKFLEAKVLAGRPDYFSGVNPQPIQPLGSAGAGSLQPGVQENMRSIIASKMMKI